jgi:V-type H+-transporting ATPase subunit a
MAIVLQLRYIILLMGLFATYCGIIYNDFMAIPVWAFESCYDLRELKEGDPGYVHHDTHAPAPSGGHHHAQIRAFPKHDCVYPVGVDPAWYLGKNELAFLNSLKMKLSVILGVL